MSTYTPSTNTDYNKAVYGENSAGVLALQNKLNSFGAGLATDSKYGPLTLAAYQKYQSQLNGNNTQQTPTIGSLYNTPGAQEDPALQQARDMQDAYYKNQIGNGSVDENKIRSDTLSQFQAEIDAVNQLYAEKLAQAKLSGAGRLGSDTAIQSRRGLLGSTFGGAETNTVNAGNDQVYAGIGAEKNAAVQSILGNADARATQLIAEKNKAIADGLDSHLKYLADAGQRKTTNANLAAQYIYNQNIDVKDLTPDQLNQTAKGYGVSPDDIKTAYISVKTAGDSAKTKAQLDAAKEKNAGLPASAQEYEYAKAHGYTGSYTQYQTEDANRKALANKAPSISLTERKQNVISKMSDAFTPGQKMPNGIPMIDNNGFATPEGFKAAMDTAQRDGVSRSDFIKSFGYLLAPGLESKYGITGAELRLVTGVTPYPTN